MINDEERRRGSQIVETMQTDEQHQLFVSVCARAHLVELAQTTTGRPPFARNLLDSLQLLRFNDQTLREVGQSLECVAKATLVLQNHMRVLARHDLTSMAMAAYTAALSASPALASNDAHSVLGVYSGCRRALGIVLVIQWQFF